VRVRAGLAVAAAGGIAILALGGYFLVGELRCDGLEDDFLNSLDSVRSIGVTQSLGSLDAETNAGLDRIRESKMKEVEQHLLAIYEQCGERAGGNASRRGSELLLGI
jgi:hypothetical protein